MNLSIEIKGLRETVNLGLIEKVKYDKLSSLQKKEYEEEHTHVIFLQGEGKSITIKA